MIQKQTVSDFLRESYQSKVKKSDLKTGMKSSNKKAAKKKLKFNSREIAMLLINARNSQEAASIFIRARSRLADMRAAAATGQYDKEREALSKTHNKQKKSITKQELQLKKQQMELKRKRKHRQHRNCC